MRYFVKLMGENGQDIFINPDSVAAIISKDDARGQYWDVYMKGETGERTNFSIQVRDISPLAEAVREEKTLYTIPIESIIGPRQL
jgi:hypothetical protein